MHLIRKFMFVDSAPTEIQIVQLEPDADRRARIDAAIAAARESMGKRLLVHPANRVQRLKAA
jgi:hypothetical protein